MTASYRAASVANLVDRSTLCREVNEAGRRVVLLLPVEETAINTFDAKTGLKIGRYLRLPAAGTAGETILLERVFDAEEANILVKDSPLQSECTGRSWCFVCKSRLNLTGPVANVPVGADFLCLCSCWGLFCFGASFQHRWTALQKSGFVHVYLPSGLPVTKK